MSKSLTSRIDALESESETTKPIWFELKSDFMKQMATSERGITESGPRSLFVDEQGRYWQAMNDQARALVEHE